MGKYVFHCLQTAGYSAHTTLEGLTEMLIQDDEVYGEMLEKDDTLLNDEQFCRNIIETAEYEILEANRENIAAYEEYKGFPFE